MDYPNFEEIDKLGRKSTQNVPTNGTVQTHAASIRGLSTTSLLTSTYSTNNTQPILSLTNYFALFIFSMEIKKLYNRLK